MIVVTGGAGFIGSNVIADLEERNDESIAVVDWLGQDERWRNLGGRAISHFVRPENAISFLDDNARDITSIIHMGAISATTERDVDRLVELNINYTVRLWEWCAANQVTFLYASSAATYGARERDFTDSNALEDLAALEPLNAYGWSKNATDIVFARRVAAGEPAPPFWAGLKFFNVYGPNEYHKGDMMSVACKLYSKVMAGDPVQLFKSYRSGIVDGDQKRDFIYVKDCTKVIAWMLRAKVESGIFNVGTGRAESFLDITNALARAVNSPVNVDFIDMPESIRDRYQYFTQADMTKLKACGYSEPFLSIEDGIADYVNAHLGRPNQYR